MNAATDTTPLAAPVTVDTVTLKAVLFATLDEARLLAAEYTDDELRAAVTAWVAAGDECFHG